MMDMATILAAVKTQLTGQLGSGYRIEVDNFVNEDPNRCPWIGLYRDEENLTPRSLGKNARRWNDDLKFIVVVQTSGRADLDQGQKVGVKLEAAKSAVMSALEADVTLGGNVQSIKGYTITYDYKRSDRTTMGLQEAIITVTAFQQTA